MLSHASVVFTLSVYACVYTVVECDSTCSNMLECTMYNIQQVGSKVDGMQSNMAAIVNQLSQIQDTLDATEHRFNALEQETEHRFKAMEQENIKIRADLNKEIEKQNTSFVSFRAFPARTRTYFGYSAYMKPLLFDYVEVNIGQHYIAENSTFICPYDAYYLFVVTLRVLEGKYMRALLLLEGNKLHRVRAEVDETGEQTTVVVVTLCLAGQRVWVRPVGFVQSDNPYELYGDGLYGESSSFSGTVLRSI